MEDALLVGERDEDPKPVVQGIPKIHRGLREDTVIQRVITTLNRD